MNRVGDRDRDRVRDRNRDWFNNRDRDMDRVGKGTGFVKFYLHN